MDTSAPPSAVRAVAAGAVWLGISLTVAAAAHAKEDIEFVQEHLPEVAMDNRYATLPVWRGAATDSRRVGWTLQAAYGRTTAGNLSIDGPLLSTALHWSIADRWHIDAFVFHDALRLKGNRESRDLQTLFAPDTPIERPVAADFTSLDGTATDAGIGADIGWRCDAGRLGQHRWLIGAMWQRMRLRDYRFDYQLTGGTQAGMTGTIDFDADYTHIVPYVGLELPRAHEVWTTNLHMLFAMPLPRRGVEGHITGPGFDIRGNTADVGNGKHFGDPSLTIGYTFTYLPAHLSIDVGSLLSQALLEPQIHRGIDRNLLLSFSVAL
jgi:hypothetical protein